MQISEQGLALIRHFEGCRLTAYRDAGNKWTIGYGHTGPGIEGGLELSQEDCDRLLGEDVARIQADVAKIAGPCTQRQFDALVSFAYNCGITNLRNSTLLRKHRAGDFEGAAAEFGRWVRAGGKRSEGLVRRRAAETAVYVG